MDTTLTRTTEAATPALISTATEDTMSQTTKKIDHVTYTKLRTGGWGLRGTERQLACAKVTVRKRSGETKTEYVDRVIWRGNGIAIATINTHARTSSSGAGRRGGWCRCGHSEDPMSAGFGKFAGQTIRCPDCQKKLEVS